jgi:cyclophilin family peptidyl-prolyl cis-trans isomerase
MRIPKCVPVSALAVAAITSFSTIVADEPKASSNPIIEMKTSMGTITIELFQDKAPITVKNFLSYVDDKHYDGTIFHRVIDGFMIQGGGMTEGGSQKKTKSPIKNEAGNGLKNDRGTIAMARTGEVDSATSQFFINHKNNDMLNHKDDTQRGFGYCAFGKVTQGMDVVDKIAKVDKKRNEGGELAVPLKNIVVESVRRVEKKAESKSK